VNFVDDRPLAQGIGVMDRRSMPLTGVGYNTWFFWDGRKDSLWSQALGPLESEVEHGITRSACFHLLRSGYAREYEELFGPLPDITEEQCPIHVGPHSGHPGGADAWGRLSPEVRGQINKAYANMGKAIAAFVRLIVPAPSKFDRFAEALLAGKEDLGQGDPRPGRAQRTQAVHRQGRMHQLPLRPHADELRFPLAARAAAQGPSA
jgi:cytochrome c peroxidase